MATTNTYVGGVDVYMRYGITSTDGAGTTVKLDSLTVVEDIPGEAITPLGNSYGEAQSAGIINYSGTFAGRILVNGHDTEQDDVLTTDAITLTRSIIRASTRVFFKGPIILSGRSIDASGGAVVKLSGNWMGADGFYYDETS